MGILEDVVSIVIITSLMCGMICGFIGFSRSQLDRFRAARPTAWAGRPPRHELRRTYRGGSSRPGQSSDQRPNPHRSGYGHAMILPAASRSRHSR